MEMARVCFYYLKQKKKKKFHIHSNMKEQKRSVIGNNNDGIQNKSEKNISNYTSNMITQLKLA